MHEGGLYVRRWEYIKVRAKRVKVITVTLPEDCRPGVSLWESGDAKMIPATLVLL